MLGEVTPVTVTWPVLLSRVTVEMVNVSRRFVVHTDRAHYDKLKKGDRVKVKYSEGNYTGTVWGADFVD